MKWHILDTHICTYIIQERPKSVLQKLHEYSMQKNKIAVSAITCAEILLGALDDKASPQQNILLEEFFKRLDAVLPWDKAAIDATIAIRRVLAAINVCGQPNAIAVAGHAQSISATLITNKPREYRHIPGLEMENWEAEQPFP